MISFYPLSCFDHKKKETPMGNRLDSKFSKGIESDISADFSVAFDTRSRYTFKATQPELFLKFSERVPFLVHGLKKGTHSVLRSNLEKRNAIRSLFLRKGTVAPTDFVNAFLSSFLGRRSQSSACYLQLPFTFSTVLYFQ